MSVESRHVCLSTDVMFSTDEITDRDIGTQMTTRTLKEKGTGTQGIFD